MLAIRLSGSIPWFCFLGGRLGYYPAQVDRKDAGFIICVQR